MAISPTAGGGPDFCGYSWLDSVDTPAEVPFNWLEIKDNGTTIPKDGWIGNSDDGFVGVSFDFSFPFYQASYSTVLVGTNGYVSFVRGYSDNQVPSIPSRARPNNAIYPLANWLRPGGAAGQGGVYYAQLGSPSRFVVEWYQVPHNDGLDPVTFEVILYQTGEIEFEYLSAGYYTTIVGIENGDGSTGLSYGTPPSDSLAIRFLPPAPTGSVGVQMSPCSATVSAALGSTVDANVSAMNTGTSDATIELNITVPSWWSAGLYESDGVTPLSDSDGDGLPDTGPLAPNDSLDFIARVTVPSNATSAQLAVVTGRSSIDSTILDRATFRWWFPLAWFVEPHSDVGLDPNDNGQFDSVMVNLTIAARTCWTYLLFVEFHDPSYALDLFSNVAFDLCPGTHTWPVSFEGWIINRSGADGPYVADFWLIAWGDYPGTFLDLGTWTTRPYKHLDFEAVPSLASRLALTTPVIDGTIADGEWNDSAVVDLTNVYGSGLPAFLYVKNDQTTLYVAYDAIGDIMIDQYDVAAIGFDTGRDRKASNQHEDQFVQGGWVPFNQAHFVYDASFGTWRLLDSPYDQSLPNEAGLESAWSFGTSPLSGTRHRMYEFAVPLALLGARAGDTLGFAGGGQIAPGAYDDFELRWSDWPEWTFGPQPLYAYGDLVLATDTHAPTVTIVSPRTGLLTNHQSIDVVWTASDVGFGVDHVEVRLDGELIASVPPSSSSVTLANLSDGFHRVDVTAIDKSGNTKTDSVTITVDTTPPSLRITAPQPDAIVGERSVIVSWTTSDATSGIAYVNVAMDGGPARTIAPNVFSQEFDGLADGPHTFVVTVVDRAGNSATSSVAIQIRPQGSNTADNNSELLVAGSLGAVVGGVALLVAFAVGRRRRRSRK